MTDTIVGSLIQVVGGAVFGMLATILTIQAQRKRLTLEFRQGGGSGNLLGRIGLRVDDKIPLEEGTLLLYCCESSRNYCTSPARFYLYELYHHYGRFRSRGQGDPYNFKMSAPALRRLFVFYICPRPVVLVTVVHEDTSNVFPMDLIGSVSDSEFSLALRSTSPAVKLMKASKRVALSDVPHDQMSVAYALGKHHNEKSIDWKSLPFALGRSRGFELPVPNFALRVRDMEISAIHSVGSHTVFLTHCRSCEEFSDGPQMCHTNGFYQEWLSRRSP